MCIRDSIIGEHGELAADGEVLEAQSDVFDAQVSLMETLSLLEASKQDYDGCLLYTSRCV